MNFDICVLGGCSEDCFFYQNEDGTYNEAPNLVYPGGKGNNQAVAAARAGARVTIITRLGNDTIGADIIKNLVINHVDTSNIEVVNGLSNDYANIYVNANDKDNDIHRFGGAIDSFTPDMIEAHKEAILNSYKIFLKTCDFNIQILIQSKKENLSKHFFKIIKMF